MDPTLSPIWTKQIYDPCAACRNDPGDKFDHRSFAVADSDTVWTTSAGVFSRSPASGDANWSVDVVNTLRPYTISHTNETVFIIAGEPGNPSGQVEAAVDRETGNRVYKDKFPHAAVEMAPVMDGETETVCRESDTIQLLAFDASGDEFHWGTDDFAWTKEFNVQQMAAGGGHIYLSGTDEQNQQEIMALDSVSGEPAWRFSPERRPVWLRFHRGRLFATHGMNHDEKPGRLICLDAAKGTRNWKYEVDADSSYDASVEHDSVVLSDMTSGTIHVFDLTSGEHVWGTQIDERIVAPPRVTADSLFVPYRHSNNPVLPEVEHGLYRYNLESRNITGQRVFYDEIQGIAATEKHAVVLSGPSIWGFD